LLESIGTKEEKHLVVTLNAEPLDS